MPSPSIFRVPSVTSVEARGRTRVRVAKQGGAVFELALPMLHEIDEWAVRQSPPLGQAAAIAALIWRGLAR